MDSLTEKARKYGEKISSWGLQNLIYLRLMSRGSKKDPLFYLGTIAITLFIAISLVTPSFTDNFNLSLANQSTQIDKFFVEPGTSVKESPDLSLIQENSLAAISPPIMATPQVLGALVDGANYQWTQNEIIEYVVGPGDNLWTIAEKFNISLETVLWANDLNKNTALQIGQKLVIPPVSGVIHHVQKGDTISQIAKTYKTETDKIVAFNNLAAEDDIYIGDILIVPEGVMPPPTVYAPAPVPIASSYFICPISAPCRITQGLHWYNAIDFSHGKCGEPIYAAAAGQVLKVRLTSSISKWAFGGAGNTIAILHPNGVVTTYGHVQTSLVSSGDYVYQGQIIALVGGALAMPGSGNSTGCHVHFGVSGARNPFAK